ncbi:uncharacterized protein [Argopecten irradians]|uniref:uncharacterized protein n=1 Tax=Argopecten irradians TaxID=31199 RepID=UPI003713BC5E
MASISSSAPIATQEEFAEFVCEVDSVGKSEDPDLSQSGSLESEIIHCGVSNSSDRNASVKNNSNATLQTSKQNSFSTVHTEDESYGLKDNTNVNRPHDKKDVDVDDEECIDGTGSQYFLRTGSYSSQFKSPKGRFIYSKSCDGSPLRLGPESVILGYVGKRCKECDTLSHEQGKHSSETLFPEELYGSCSKTNSSKGGTLESLVVFNTLTGQRLLPDGCEEQTPPHDDKHSTEADSKNDNSSNTKSKLHDTFMLVCKNILVYSVSNVGLACIVVGYAILGAIIFQSLEAWNEKETRSTISEIRTARMEELRNIVNTLNHLDKEPWKEKAEVIMKKFQLDLYTKTKTQGWDGVDDVVQGERQWTFVGALLYSVILITTIGYGDITPKTAGGRVATMFYAMVGIPLTLLCLANLGNVMAQAFRQLFYRLEFKIENLFSYLKRRYIASTHGRNSNHPLIRFCTRLIQCRNNKDSEPEMELEERQSENDQDTKCVCCQDVCEKVCSCDFAKTPSAGSSIGSRLNLPIDSEKALCNQTCQNDNHGDGNLKKDNQTKCVGSSHVDLTCSNEDICTHKENGTIPVTPMKEKTCRPKTLHKGMSVKQKKKLARDVPIWVCLIIVIIYNLLGSVLFGLWETGWGFLTGFYFCFITLSTIGFGDVVPGHSIESWQSQEKQMICTIYLLVGLAMLAMCFDLMQRQIREWAKHCAIWMGLLDENESEKITAV